jgi:hypothetical protein
VKVKTTNFHRKRAHSYWVSYDLVKVVKVFLTSQQIREESEIYKEKYKKYKNGIEIAFTTFTKNPQSLMNTGVFEVKVT